MWECVNRQSSWLGGVTVNLEMKDLETEKLFLEVFRTEGAVLMPPISMRLGELIDGYGRWWRREGVDDAEDMAAMAIEYGLPWFDRIRTPQQQAENWYGRGSEPTDRGYHGPSLIGLALSLHRMGEAEEACAVLRKPVPRTAIKASVMDVALLRQWLGSDSA